MLDEGVDVPEASVAIVLSGSGSPRQFRQRLGRILRPREGKQAVLYEVLSRDTSEMGTAARRKRGMGRTGRESGNDPSPERTRTRRVPRGRPRGATTPR